MQNNPWNLTGSRWRSVRISRSLHWCVICIEYLWGSLAWLRLRQKKSPAHFIWRLLIQSCEVSMSRDWYFNVLSVSAAWLRKRLQNQSKSSVWRWSHSDIRCWMNAFSLTRSSSTLLKLNLSFNINVLSVVQKVLINTILQISHLNSRSVKTTIAQIAPLSFQTSIPHKPIRHNQY